ncbi:MAG: SusC/RagA family TonB-linked outer membrane protein [Cyclobacteriaceae bacterium]
MNKKKYILTLLALIFLSVQAWAQDRSVSGKVKDSNGESLPGVNVLIKGTTTGVVTDIDGNYKISATDESIIAFSFVGYVAQDILVGAQSVIDVVLTEDNVQLETVVISAMGIERSEKSLSYARQAIDADDMKEARTSNFLQGLSGKAAGVQVTNSLTATGSNRVTIRGNASLLGNNNPLYVLDGVPLDQTAGDAQQGSWGGADNYQPVDYGDPMSNINPDDIESIEILKGGNATALYGSRASNGVILITTKKGNSKDGWGISINSNTMFQNVNQWPNYQYAYGSGNNGAAAPSADRIDPASGLPVADVSYSYGSPLLGTYNVANANGVIGPYNPVFGNVKELFQTGTTLSNTISLNKAHDNGTFRFGYTSTQGEWMMDGQDKINRHNFSLRATQKLSKKLSADVSMFYTRENVDNRIVENGSTQNPAQNYINLHPNLGARNLIPWKTENGFELSSAAGDGLLRNPYWNIYENSNGDETDRVIANMQLSYEVYEDLTVTARVNNDIRNQTGFKYDAPRGPDVRGDKNGRYRAWDRRISNWNFDGLASYSKTFEEITVDATVGVKRWNFNSSNRQSINQELLEIPGVISIQNNAGQSEASEQDSKRVLNSVFGSANVGYKGIVFLNGTLTREWSSTLSLDNNNYSYPSVGGTFIFTEVIPENKILSFGKLRASYAITGNSANPYQVYPTYTYGGNYNGSAAFLRTNGQRNNLNLANEETSSIEFGIEAKFLGDRISANLTYYSTESYDQIVPGNVAAATGFNTVIANAGLLTNKGFELYIGAEVLQGPIKWDVDLNWSNNRNEVVHLDGVDALGNPFSFDNFSLNNWGGGARIVAQPGEPYGNITGIDIQRDSEGRPLINADNGQPIESPNSILGNYQADWLGSVRNSVRWKGISFNFLIDIKAGGDLLSMTHGRSSQFGVNAYTLEGRDEFIMSSRVLGENQQERSGDGIEGTEYNRGDRVQGALFEGVLYEVFDAAGTGNGVSVTSGKANDIYLDPNTWGFLAWRHHWRSVFDASYVKLREVTLGYNLPNSILDKTPIRTAKISIVGRNLATLLHHTPRGIDPEANSTSGNGQGLEYGAFLPSRSVGFNINLSF